MYYLSNEERRLISARLLPEVRSAGVAEELRGWNWSRPPLAPIYDGKLSVGEVTSQACASGRDLYLRYVLGQGPAASAPSPGVALRAALRETLIEAKRLIYQHGARCLPALVDFVEAQAVDMDLLRELAQLGGGNGVLVSIGDGSVPEHSGAQAVGGGAPRTGGQHASSQDAPVPGSHVAAGPGVVAAAPTRGLAASIPLTLLRQFEARRILQATEQVLLANPKIGADALASLAVPVTVGYRLDGSLLGLRKQQSVDMLHMGSMVPLLIKFGRRDSSHRLSIAGYALIAESLLEQPVDIGCVVYVAGGSDGLTIDRDILVINDELRQEFIELRDERMRMIEEEIDPGLVADCADRCASAGRCRRNP